MNDRRIAIGVLTWFLGISVPVAHHVLLYAFEHYERSDNAIRDMTSIYENLPWIDFLYFGLMMVAGLLVVASGLRSRGGSA